MIEATSVEGMARSLGAGILKPAGSAALLGSNILLFVGLFSIAPALPAVRADFAHDSNVDLLTQLVGALAGFAFALGSLGVGQSLARFGYRGVYIISLLIFALAGSGAAAFHNLYAIIGTRALVGVATAGILNASLFGISQLPPSTQARMLGIQALVGGIGAIAIFPLVGLLAGIDWRLAFGIHLTALLFLPLVLALPETKKTVELDVAQPRARGVGLLIISSAAFAGMVGFIGTMFGPLFLVQLGVSDAKLLSIPPTGAAIGAMTGSAIYVFLRPRLGLNGTFVFALSAMATGLATSATASTVWQVALGSFITAIGGGAFSPNLNAAAFAASPENPGPALGIVNGVSFGAMILFPLILNPLATFVGGSAGVLVGYSLVAVAFAVTFLINRQPVQHLAR